MTIEGKLALTACIFLGIAYVAGIGMVLDGISGRLGKWSLRVTLAASAVAAVLFIVASSLAVWSA